MRVIPWFEAEIAFDSNDHLFKWGTMRDNSTNFAFIGEVIHRFKDRKFNVLDLGASGGKLIEDFIPFCNYAIGLEGSDYSLKNRRESWLHLTNKNLFTCDVSRKFEIRDINNTKKILFELITAWEVVEHIKTDRLKVFFQNIWDHMTDDGIFSCSISTVSEPAPGAKNGEQLHETVWNKEKWLEYLISLKMFKILTDDKLIFVNRVRREHGSFQLDFRKAYL